MAIYDNKHWLLSHIRNSFISTDDTGMCEIVMLGEDFPKLLHAKSMAEKGKIELSTPSKTADDSSDEEYERERVMEFDCYPEMDQSDEDDMDPLTESYDLQHDMDFGMHSSFNRQRSNTAQKLEKMDLAQRKAAKIKMVKWENPPNVLSDLERETLFTRKEITPTEREGRSKSKSMLTDQLVKCPFLPQSKFLEYAKFDGTAQFGLPTKTYKIFMTMVPEAQRNYPIHVSVVASAKILDLIGFTCYKYSIAHPEFALGSVSSYGLYICEDDGEVDWDFPSLDAREACSKFGLTCLGLVDLKCGASAKPHGEVHTSSIPEKGGFNVITIPPEDKSNHSMRSRSATYESREKQVIEPPVFPPSRMSNIKNGKSGQANTSNVTFGEEATKTRSVLVNNLRPTASSVLTNFDTEFASKSHTSSSPQEAEALNRMKVHEKVIEAPLYQSYRVRVANRVRANTQILLGISGERIEIDPLYAGSNKFWPRMKPVSYNIESVAWCELIESKSNRSTFRLVYSPNHSNSLNQEPSPSSGQHHHGMLNSNAVTFKHHDFECENSAAKEIVEKINRILELQSSSCRKEYKAARERKFQARRSFHMSKSS